MERSRFRFTSASSFRKCRHVWLRDCHAASRLRTSLTNVLWRHLQSSRCLIKTTKTLPIVRVKRPGVIFCAACSVVAAIHNGNFSHHGLTKLRAFKFSTKAVYITDVSVHTTAQMTTAAVERGRNDVAEGSVASPKGCRFKALSLVSVRDTVIGCSNTDDAWRGLCLVASVCCTRVNEP